MAPESSAKDGGHRPWPHGRSDDAHFQAGSQRMNSGSRRRAVLENLKLPERPSAADNASLQGFQSKSVSTSRLRLAQKSKLVVLLRPTIYAAEIEGHLQATFYLKGKMVFTADIGRPCDLRRLTLLDLGMTKHLTNAIGGYI